MPKTVKKPEVKKKKKVTKRRVKKNPINILIQIILFCFLIVASAITYFAVTLAISPRSIPVVTKNIEAFLSKATKKKVIIQDSRLHITSSANLKVSADNLEIIEKSNNSTIIILPEVDIEIPILSMLIGNFNPKKITISNANLHIDHHSKIKKESTPQANNEEKIKQILSQITRFFVKLKNNSHRDSIFEIKNTNLTFISKNSSKSLYIKNSQIRSDYRFGKLLINFENQITISNSPHPFNLNAECIVNKSLEANCHIQTKDLNAKSFSWLHLNLGLLNNINANFNIDSRLKYNLQGLQELTFDATSKNGNFKYDGFFDKRIFFKTLSANGTYNHKSQNLNFEDITINLEKQHQDYTTYNINPMIKMKINIFKDKQIYNLQLTDILTQELDKLWPSHLAKDGSRKWSINHLSKGYIKTSNADFTVKNTKLVDITANMALENITINYNAKFPVVTKVNAKAIFGIDSMDIKITKGQVLKSKITSGQIAIKSFVDKNSKITIKGKLQGHGSDLLKHAAYKSNFSKHVSKYFNGQSTSSIDVSIPLNNETTTKSLYLKATSKIKNNHNSYLDGDAIINISTKSTSPIFNVTIDTQRSDVNCDVLGIHKNNNDKLLFTLAIDTKNLDNIKLNNIKISQENSNKTITGNMAFNTGPFKITKIDINNSNFNQNNFDLNFDLQEKKLSIKGQKLTLADAIQNKAFTSNTDSGVELDYSKLQIVLKELDLAQNNALSDAYIFYDCEGGLCKDGIVSLRKNNKQFLKLDIKETEKDYTKFNGKIFNVGELAEALGISDLVKGGKAKITAKNTIINNKFALTGTIEVYSDVTIFENESIKLLEKDSLYLTIKNKIFSNQKTKFNKVKIKFELIDKIFKIKSLIANNYKIGITAKGTIDLENKVYNLEGFILPGYIVNNLFGLGDIPIIGEIANLLTNGQGGGLFGIKYEYSKKKNEKDFHFQTNKMSALVPTTIQGMF